MDNGGGKPTTKNVKNENLDSTGAQNSTPKKRKRKEVAIFGNYRNYYGYRISQELEEDPRMKVFKKEWFEGKDCLDIGCNSGLITINIAKNFCCRSILGVDIDSDRIEEAYWNLRKIAKASTRKLLPKASKLENVEEVNNVDHPVTEPLSEETRKIPRDSSPSTLLDKVSFQRENFVLSRRPEDKRYDTIICLSVTKWIHLNWGDDGLINLFAKICRLLQPGGMLILEPQPWNSYYKNRKVSETAQNNYHKIEIHPDNFQEILLDKIGFRFVENISCNLPGSKSGFQRPILAFWK